MMGIVNEKDYKNILRISQVTENKLVLTRLSILLYLHAGLKVKDIAKEVGRSEECVTKCIRSYKENGLQKYLDVCTKSEKTYITEEDYLTIKKLIDDEKYIEHQKHLKALMLRYEGKSIPEIARTAEVCETSVSNTLKRYKDFGVDGILNKTPTKTRKRKADSIKALKKELYKEDIGKLKYINKNTTDDHVKRKSDILLGIITEDSRTDICRKYGIPLGTLNTHMSTIKTNGLKGYFDIESEFSELTDQMLEAIESNTKECDASQTDAKRDIYKVIEEKYENITEEIIANKIEEKLREVLTQMKSQIIGAVMMELARSI